MVLQAYMNNLKKLKLICPNIFIGIFLASLINCSPKKKVVVETKFCLNDAMMQSLKIAKVDSSNFNVQLILPGSVSFDDDKVVKIFPLVSGIVKEVKVQVGDHVKKGQVLAIIKSSEMAGYSNDLVNARANVEITTKNLVKTKDLFSSGLASQLDILNAEKDQEKAKSDLNRITSILNVNGSSAEGSDYIVKSPTEGYIVDKQINPNTQIRNDNGNNLFMISDLSKVWVVANVYEADIVKVGMGQEVSITTLSYPDKIFSGKIDRIYNVLDPVNKTMKVRIQLPNPGFLLKPLMFANVSVKTKTIRSKIGIPSAAIIFDNSKNYVMVYRDKCDVETREIKVAYSDAQKTYIEEGLVVGEQIIIQNPLYVYQAFNE